LSKPTCMRMDVPRYAAPGGRVDGTRSAVMGLPSPSRLVPAQTSRQVEPFYWAGIGPKGEGSMTERVTGRRCNMACTAEEMEEKP
jgi:hypothetical protein